MAQEEQSIDAQATTGKEGDNKDSQPEVRDNNPFSLVLGNYRFYVECDIVSAYQPELPKRKPQMKDIVYLRGTGLLNETIWEANKVYLVRSDGEIPEDPEWISCGSHSGFVRHTSIKNVLEHWLIYSETQQIITNLGTSCNPMMVTVSHKAQLLIDKLWPQGGING